MTRNEIESQFTVQDGCIKDCGKFEGEFVYAPYFSEFASDGEILSSMEDGCGNFNGAD